MSNKISRIEQLIKEYESDDAFNVLEKKCIEIAKTSLTWDRVERTVKMFELFDTATKCSKIWEYEHFAGHPQNKLCAAFGVSPRHYRDVRDQHLHEWENEVWMVKGVLGAISDTFTSREELNVYALEEAYGDMKLLGIPGAEEWFNGEEVPEVERFLAKVWEHAGGYTDVWDKWTRCKPLRYYISLTPDEQAEMRGEGRRK